MVSGEQYERDAPVSDEVIDREELTDLAFWHWQMRGYPEDHPDQDWFWAEEELLRMRRAAGYDIEVAW